MSRKQKNPNRQGFLNRVEDIRTAERDVDKLLDAARLKRIENGAQPLTAKQRITLYAIGGAGGVFTVILVLGYLSGHFVPALIGVGFIAFIGIMVGAMMCD